MCVCTMCVCVCVCVCVYTPTNCSGVMDAPSLMLALMKTEPAGGDAIAEHSSLPPAAGRLQAKPASVTHKLEQPSSLCTFASSQSSAPVRRPSPHVVAGTTNLVMPGAGVVCEIKKNVHVSVNQLCVVCFVWYPLDEYKYVKLSL